MYYLGIDIGGTYSKVALYDENAKELEVNRKIANLSSPHPAWVERDMDELWQDVCALIKKTTQSVDKSKIVGVSVSAHGKGLYPLGKNGQIIRPAILSADGRSIEIVQSWYEKKVNEQAYQTTLQNLWTGHPVSILRWLKEHEPQNYEKIDTILMAHDYIRYRLCGDVSVELTNISESNLYNSYSKDFDPQLYQLFGIEEMQGKMPKIIGSAEDVGSISSLAVQECGLTASTKVYGGLFDVVAASLCAGLTSTSQMNCVFGTWSVSSIIDDKPQTNNRYNYVWGEHCMEHTSLLHDASPTSASNFEWFVQQFLTGHDNPYQYANEKVAQSDYLKNDIIFSPFLYGSNKKLGMPAGFYGLKGHHKIGDIIAAIWQGVCFAQKTHADRLIELYPNINVIRVNGGSANSPLWMQMFADIMGLPLEVPNIKELGCFGAMLCTFVGSHHTDSFKRAIATYVNDFTYYQPNMDNHQIYKEKYTNYQTWLERQI